MSSDHVTGASSCDQAAALCHHLLTAVCARFVFPQVQESFVPLGGASGELGLAIGGGADYGEFPFVTAAHGGGATVGDIILEIGGTPVLGMTLGDVRGVLNSCPHPIRIKTVSPGLSRHPIRICLNDNDDVSHNAVQL